MDDIARLRAVTGITEAQLSDAIVDTLIDLNPGKPWCAAADAADRVATSLIDEADVTKVEDIAVDTRRVIEQWRALADRLRARCDAAEDDGPYVVDFCPSPGVEAVEHGW